MIVNNYFRPMSPKPFGLLLTALFASVPAAVFGQSNPRQGQEINAAEILASSTLDLPDPAEAAEFDRTFSQPFPINDGIPRNYILATDELYQPTADGSSQILKITGADTASSLAAVARILSSELRLETYLVMYPAGVAKNDHTRRTVSKEVVVKTKDPAAAIQAANRAGLVFKSSPAYAPEFVFFSAQSPAQGLAASALLRSEGFPEARPLLHNYAEPEFLPTDSYFRDQWHIRGRGQNGAKKASDARITPVWEQRDSSGNLLRGTGITIGVVDDGVQMDHPDLMDNISSSHRRNFNDGTPDDPSPGPGDDHGTAVAGVAAAVGFNGIGVTGAAPDAKIAPIRLIGGGFTSLDEAEAYTLGGSSVRIKSNSWSRQTQVNSLQPDDDIVQAALASAANSGTIITFSGGNDLAREADTNQRGLKNSIYTLPIAALNDQGRQCDYSNPGASLIVGAPAGGDVYGLSSSRPQGTSTTDRTGDDGYNLAGTSGDYSDKDYTSGFNGTSSATPVVSGVTALVLQANPSLNWRDVKEIYIRSATRNDSGDSDWARNGAGFWFNHKYGAGLINASEAVRLAKNWSNLGSMSSVSIPLSSLPANIRDNNAGGLVKYFDTRSLSGLRVEHATVTTDISHPSRGELQIQLTSPAGTTSRLAEKHTSYAPDPADYPDWTFSTVHNWGEDSRGLWKLKIADRVPGNTGTLNSATLTLYGTAK
jgi:subtilisin family serine protease